MVGVLIDITERKRAEQEVMRLNEDLERRVQERTSQLAIVNNELEEFAASVSHDLRSPLRNIAGYAALLQEEVACLSDETRQNVAAILRETGRGAQLIDDLLNLARIGRMALNRQSVDLGTLVREVLEDVARDAGDRRIEWQIEPLATVPVDRGLMRQVFINLFSNAVKFTSDRDPAVIRVGMAPPELHPGECVIYVCDNGAGFDMKQASRLFSAFQRLHTEREFKGTGVGLANVKRIVQRHSGAVWAESSPGNGACFYFSLPLGTSRGIENSAAA